eukprot:COSAG04_NODE_7482_length_1120_cov_1.228208_1_plen_188_part_00
MLSKREKDRTLNGRRLACEHQVISKFAEQCDLILLLFDANKTDIGDEMQASPNAHFRQIKVVSTCWFRSKVFSKSLSEIGDGLQEAMAALKGNEDKVRVVLNKSDVSEIIKEPLLKGQKTRTCIKPSSSFSLTVKRLESESSWSSKWLGSFRLINLDVFDWLSARNCPYHFDPFSALTPGGGPCAGL